MAIQYVNDSVTVGATSTQIVGNREHRQHLALTNNSDETIFLALNAPAVLNKGMPLVSGETLVLEEKDHVNEAIYGICSSGGKEMAIMERYLDQV